jgi:hypothetical protein
LKNIFTKISLFILIGVIIFGCNSTKRVPQGKKLLTKNEIIVDGKISNEEAVVNQLSQKPNSSILGYRLRLNIYNLAKQKTDSLYRAKLFKKPKKYNRLVKLLSKKQVKRLGESFLYAGVNNFLMKTGEAPVILDTLSTVKSVKRLKSYYFNNGFFNVITNFKVDTINPKKVQIKYTVKKGKPYFLDTISSKISTKVLDSLFKIKKNESFLITGKQFNTANFSEERIRITNDFRNNGAYQFQQNYINFDIDTIKTNGKANIKLIIDNQSVFVNDTTTSQPFKLYRISKINIFTDQSSLNTNVPIKDSIRFNNFNLYGYKKIKYKPKAITDAVFITKGSLFSDTRTSLTSKYLSNLKVFNYPLIQYSEDKNDENSLIANIYLSPRPKYHFGTALDLTHSNIQDIGINANTSVTIRNVFNGAETFEIAARGIIGSSKVLANPNDNFFNISEIGLDGKLNFPRMFLPFNTEKIIPKTMIPYTSLSGGFSKQRNIGLDKLNFTSALTYNWIPRKNITSRFDLFNIQYVKCKYFELFQCLSIVL